MSAFTLIEVAVALAIVGITFAALFGQISQSVSGIPRIESSTQLIEHAREKLREIQLIPVIAPDQQVEGEFADGVRWRIGTALFIPPRQLDPGHILQVTVEVERDGTRMSFSRYRYQEFIPPDIRPITEQLDAIRIPS